MQKSILDAFPNADLSVSVVWIDMLPTDNVDAADKIAATMNDPRVQHFHDPRASHLAGKAFATGLLEQGGGLAWDVYLFYDRAAVWGDAPPRPVEWWHQLSGGRRADPARYAAGRLVEQLHETMHQVTGADCLAPGGE